MAAIQHIILENNLDSFDKVNSFFRKEPYHLHVVDDKPNNLYLLKYDQINTDFTLPASCEARGIILEKITNRVVCYPFKKFFNAGERHAAEIDWQTAVVQHKYDGSIMKIYWNDVKNEWVVATNGTTDAHNANVGTINQGRTFFDLFQEAASLSNFNYARLDKDCTYMFELMHPESTIVIRYTVPKLIHIGTRNVKTFLESYENIGVEQVETFALTTYEDCRRAAAALGASQEGFVVRDAQYNRIKIKGAVYVQLHHSLTDLHLTVEEAAAQMILKGQCDEIQAYADDKRILKITEKFATIESLLDGKATRLADLWKKVNENKPKTQKEIVSESKKHANEVFPYMMARARFEKENQVKEEKEKAVCEAAGEEPKEENSDKQYFKKLILERNASESLKRSDVRDFLDFIKKN